MRNPHAWNLLALDVPNLLPSRVPWVQFSFSDGFRYEQSEWVRPAGRMIWATILFVIGLVAARIALKRPKRSDEPATWAATIVGAMYVWVMFILGYAVIPSEWIVFGNSYLNFDSATFMLQQDQWGANLPPFDITRDKFVDAVAGGIYIVVLVINIAMFAAWQKRKTAAEAQAAAESGDEGTEGGGPLARLRARRARRTSAYGRPVTTSGA
ncbi:MAG: hypothetical protein ACKOBG_09140 [Actinomycetota bacterium]